MAFNKFDPDGSDDSSDEGSNPTAIRRARLLKYGWWVTIVYTAIGFVFLGLFWLGVFP